MGALMKYTKISLTVFVFFMVACSALSLYAQQGRGRGRIRGTVHDEAGNPLEGAKIVATHVEYNTVFEGESDKKGNWAIAGLGTGRFRIVASKDGYGTVDHMMRISQFSKKNPPIDITLNKIQEVSKSLAGVQDEMAISLFKEGNSFFEQGKYEEAAVKFIEFSVKNPSFYQIYINIGNCYREMGDYEKATAAYNKILDKVKEEKGDFEGDETAARALAAIGETYMRQEKLEDAHSYFQQAMEVFPEDETLAFNVGEIYFSQGNIEKAIEYFNLAVRFQENWAPPYRRLGYAYLNRGEYKLALESFQKFLALAPDDPHAESIKNLIPKIEELIK